MTPAMSTALGLHTTQTQEKRALRRSLTDDNWGAKMHALRTLMQLPMKPNFSRLSEEEEQLHRALFLEEASETLVASAEGDTLEVIDGIMDTIVVGLGWLLHMGLTPETILRCMEEVHASNMTKTDDEGNPIFADGSDPAQPAGKFLKGPNFQPPDLAAILGL